MGYLIVFIGSGLGGMLRYAVGMLSIRVFGTNFPYGTLGINVLGSALMGIVVGVFTASNLTSQDAKLFLTRRQVVFDHWRHWWFHHVFDVLT